MKREIVLGLLLFICNMVIAQQEEFSGVCKDLSHIVEAEQHQHERILGFRTNELTQNYDLKYHRLEWEVDPTEHYIKGKVTSYFVVKEADVQQIHFDLSTLLSVNEILYHGQSLSYVQGGNDDVEISLPNPIQLGVLDSITISYEGAPPNTGFGSFITSTHRDTAVMWTLSEPYGAKDWWPCKQDLSDKIDSIDVIVRTPKNYRVASNGVLVEERAVGKDKIYHWKHRHPIPTYLIAIAVTNYEVFSNFVPLYNGDSIEVLNYVYPESLNSARNQTQDIVEIMTFFNEKFGLYPFASEKYGHAQFGWGGGMEHQTMSFMGSFSYGLQAHELAHQWFGDKVTCGSWEDIWLNEGFATYLTGLTNEFLRTPALWRNWKINRILNITNRSDGSVWVDDTASVSRIFNSRLTYSKGAMLLHMLRWKLGDDNFFQAIRNYLNDPNLAFGYAKTIDLQRHLESQSGQELDEFFNDWFYNQGYPSYRITWSNLGDRVLIRLGQVTSHSSVDFFEMPVPVWVSGEGQDSLLRLEHTFNGEAFEIALPFSVDSVRFDPDFWLISIGNTIEQVLVSSTEETLFSQAISVAPNPVKDVLTIQIDKQYEVDQISVFNINGKHIRNIHSKENTIKLDTREWSSGIYLIVFRTNDLKTTVQVVKT